MARPNFKYHAFISTLVATIILLFVSFFSSGYYILPKGTFRLYQEENSMKNASKTEQTANTEQIHNSNGLQCMENGWSKEGTRLFWPYYFFPIYPSLHDIFEDNGVLHVILSSFLVSSQPQHRSRITNYVKATWALYFHENNETENRDIVINPNDPIITKSIVDPHSYMINLRFELPKQYQNKYNFATIQLLYNESELSKVGKESIYRPPNPKEPLLAAEYYNPMNETIVGYYYMKTFIKEQNPESITNINDLCYRNVPFCPIKDKFSIYVNEPDEAKLSNLTEEEKIYISPNGQKKDFLTICACTLIYDQLEKNEVVFRWILFHLDQGFEPPILYINRINGSSKTALSFFDKAVEENKVKLVDFIFPYAHYAHDQVSQEMSCLERTKGRTVWLAFNNVDERFFHSDANPSDEKNDLTTAEIVKKYHTNVDNYKSLGALQCPNMWMQRFENDTSMLDRQQNFHERTKCIMIPENTEYFSQHFITLGKPMRNCNDIANGHFKIVTSKQDLWVIHFTDKIYSPKMTEINKRLTKEMNRLFYNKE